jgi:surface carbohydrate biosynthesis protein (TIGR04326 family)
VSAHPPHVVVDCERRRRELTDRYVAAIASLGGAEIGSFTVSNLLTVDGIDAWAASSLRESSLWADDDFFARVTALATGRATTPRNTKSIGRACVEALGYALRSLVQVFRERDSRVSRRASTADVVVVDYATRSLTATPYLSPYVGKLDEVLRSDHRSVAWLHLTSSGTPTSLTSDERTWMHAVAGDHAHGFVRQFVTPSVVLSALRSWWTLQRRAPRWSEVVGAASDTDVHTIAPLLANDYVRSVHGTVAMRTMLLGHALRRAVVTVRRDAIVIHPFEGQGWETLLINECAAQDVMCVSYLHTIMKPWDVRALTALTSVKAQRVVVHGAHDEAEICRTRSAVHVAEALRYQHLARAVTRTTDPDAPVLFVGGADCEESSRLFDALVAANGELPSPMNLWVKWHPQCAVSRDSRANVTVVSDALDALFPRVRGVILAATAAPLDSYLAGVPTCSIVAPGAFSTNPLTADDTYLIAANATEAIGWMAGRSSESTSTASTSQPGPDVGRWFVIDPELPRWRALIERLFDQRSDAR